MFNWGPAVQFGLAIGGPDFCKWCVHAIRTFHIMVLRRNPTFIGKDMPVEDL